jgi:RNA-directed DNA polymerase
MEIKRINIVQALSDYLGYEVAITQDLMRKACFSYKRYFIKKKDGGARAILHPSAATKSLQYGIIKILLESHFPPHPCAMAYVKNRAQPIVTNAKMHSKFKFSIRVDFKEFFPSIQPRDLLERIRQKAIELSSGDQFLLEKAVFVPKYLAVRSYTADKTRTNKQYASGQYGLAIGAPSSPMISNIVMFELDVDLLEYANQNDGIFTRYADDVIYSTNTKGDCEKFLGHLRGVVERMDSPKLTINENKTMYMSRGSRRVVTGLRITPDGNISLGHENKRRIRAMLHWLRHGKLDEKGKKYLRGYLSYILGTEPDFYNRLTLKYGGALIRKAHYDVSYV